MTLPPRPELLRLAGLDWRIAVISDAVYVIKSWYDDGLLPFLKGAGLSTYKGAEINPEIQPWRPDLGIETEGGTESFLMIVYQSKVRKLITDTWASGSVIVVFDADEPITISAWGCKEWVRVKPGMRGMGLGTLLKEAFHERAASAAA